MGSILIKRYAGCRLYSVATSTHVTLGELGCDITHEILDQIEKILDQLD
jgi:polyhydroxyalkanoate synthesis regulator protein